MAALDLGTNNCRLLVARANGEGFEVLDAFSRAVRLGEGVENSNMLSEPAQTRALKALRICAGKMRYHRVSTARLIATEACRRAVNAAEFLAMVDRETGLRMSVITAEEEARLAVAGCAPLIDPDSEQVLVFDIGGGSTELIWVDLADVPCEGRGEMVRALAPVPGTASPMAAEAATRITDWISVPLGVSTLHDRFRHVEDEAERFTAMARHFQDLLLPFTPCRVEGRAARTRALQMIGVSGTATTFGALYLGLRSYDRGRVDGLWLPAREAEAIAARLLTMGRGERGEHPGIGAGRAELVLSGSAILMTLLRLWPVERLRIADRGLREGMLYSLLHERRIAAQ